MKNLKRRARFSFNRNFNSSRVLNFKQNSNFSNSTFFQSISSCSTSTELLILSIKSLTRRKFHINISWWRFSRHTQNVWLFSRNNRISNLLQQIWSARAEIIIMIQYYKIELDVTFAMQNTENDLWIRILCRNIWIKMHFVL